MARHDRGRSAKVWRENDLAVSISQSEGARYVTKRLRGDYTYNDTNGQLWVHLKECDVWLVNYKRSSDNIRYRKQHSLHEADRFWFYTEA